MPEPNKYIYEIKCLGCGCVAELTVIAGPYYLDIHGSEWNGGRVDLESPQRGR
jgi:hypothetical protein